MLGEGRNVKILIIGKECAFGSFEFIRQFPIAILACSNYIVNSNKVREIDGIFDVNYDSSFTTKKTNQTFNFVTSNQLHPFRCQHSAAVLCCLPAISSFP